MELSIFIIGNKLHEFSNNRNIFTYNEFSYLLTIESKLLHSKNKYVIHVGQGLNDKKIHEIQKKIITLHLSNRFYLAGSLLQANRVTACLSHKIKSENNLISEPEKLSDYKFKSHLLIDEECAEMSDHITGQHIQGMVLVEACRQMVNSVSEKYLISRKNTLRKGFVLNSLNTTFLEYVFPLEVELLLTLGTLKTGLGGNFKAETSIHIYQNKKIMMKADFNFSVMDKETLLNIESQMAETSVEQAIAQNEPRTLQQKNVA